MYMHIHYTYVNYIYYMYYIYVLHMYIPLIQKHIHNTSNTLFKTAKPI